MLIVDRIQVIYDRHILGVKSVSLNVEEGRLVALMGPNGAGKSTTLKAVSGVGRLERAEVTRGKVVFEGRDVTNKSPEEVAKLGILHVLEGRRVFEEMTVEEHLRLAARTARRFGKSPEPELVFRYFPRLKELLGRRAGYLSGGEQQMLVIGMALMIRPRVMLLDEPSLGLSPKAVYDLFHILRDINRNEGITILLAEQNVAMSLEIAHYGYIIEGGHVVLDGPASALKENPDVKEFYLGLKGGYKEAKYWRRKKRYL
jgi:ABC-type branched-subunit amino acid transport system ATPase component